MADAKRVNRINVWPTYELAAQAEEDAASADCKRTNRLTVWQTEEQAAENTHLDEGSGGGGGYHADAVHFDGPVSTNQVTGIPDQVVATKWMLSYWVKFDNIGGSPTPLADIGYNWATIGWNDTGDVIQSLQPEFEYADAHSIDPNTRFRFGCDPGTITAGSWFHIAISADTNFGAGSKIGQMYVNGVNVVNPALTEDIYAAFSFASAPPFCVPEDGINGYIEIADVQLWVDVRADLSNPANLAKFISGGKPVDPAEATVAFGQQTILLSGDATGFLTNLGTAFTLTGTLTNATSPSD